MKGGGEDTSEMVSDEAEEVGVVKVFLSCRETFLAPGLFQVPRSSDTPLNMQVLRTQIVV